MDLKGCFTAGNPAMPLAAVTFFWKYAYFTCFYYSNFLKKVWTLTDRWCMFCLPVHRFSASGESDRGNSTILILFVMCGSIGNVIPEFLFSLY